MEQQAQQQVKIKRKQFGGHNPNKIPFEDKKVPIQVLVKRKYFTKAMQEVTELIQKYR